MKQTEHDLSLLKSWSGAKVYQLSYWKLITHVLSYDIDIFSKSLMTQAEAAEVGEHAEESNAIVGLIVSDKDQFKNLW